MRCGKRSRLNGWRLTGSLSEIKDIKRPDELFDDRKLRASAATDPPKPTDGRSHGDEAPELTAEDEEILDRIWTELAEAEP